MSTEHRPLSQDQIKSIRNTKRWAQKKANKHGVPVIIETPALRESDKSWCECFFKLEQDKTTAGVLSIADTAGDFAVTENSVMVFCKKWPRR